MQLRRDEMAGSGYATNSRRKILDFLKSNSDRTVTAADIDQYLKRNGDAVNITTIYRYLDKLATDGTVMKYVAEAGGKAVYQYVELGQHCEEHLHLKCVKCGCIIHLDLWMRLQSTSKRTTDFSYSAKILYYTVSVKIADGNSLQSFFI